MYSCIIVDDERPALKLLEAYIDKLPTLSLLQSCENAEEAIAALQMHTPDILLLDIQMPELTGIELLQSMKIKAKVILTTAYRDYAIKGFDLGVVDYLVKPFSFPRFAQAIEKASQNIAPQENMISKPQNEYLFVRTNHKLERLDILDIIYIESKREYIDIHTENRRYIVNQSMVSMLTQLPEDNFIRIHRSYIVNLDYIQSIRGNMVCVADRELTIGGSFRTSFFDKIRMI